MDSKSDTMIKFWAPLIAKVNALEEIVIQGIDKSNYDTLYQKYLNQILQDYEDVLKNREE